MKILKTPAACESQKPSSAGRWHSFLAVIPNVCERCIIMQMQRENQRGLAVLL